MKKTSLLIGICALMIIALSVVTVVFANRTFSTEYAAEISSEHAKQIALQDSGEELKNATFTRNSLEKEKGRLIYRIDFHTAEAAYEYEIDGNTGSIYHRETQTKELVKLTEAATRQESSPEEPAEETETENGNTPEAKEDALRFIGVEQAQGAALRDAGLTAREVQFEKASLDHEDGRIVYDIHFWHQGYEYEYKVDATDAMILEKEIEYSSVVTDYPPEDGAGRNGYYSSDRYDDDKYEYDDDRDDDDWDDDDDD